MTMKMGRSVLSPSRFNYRSLAFFGYWQNQESLEDFLRDPPYKIFRDSGWHVRMKLYRKWGHFSGLNDAPLYEEHAKPKGPVVAITIARLKVRHTLRFAKWGKPVEKQIRDHAGKTCSRVTFRPFNTFSTFSTWKSEEAMLGMVRGLKDSDSAAHRDAMVERARKPFHFEFMTLRLAPLSTHGEWDSVRDETTPAGIEPIGNGK